MFHFTIRDVLWLTVVVGMAVGMYAAWQADRAILALRLSREQVRAMKAENEADELRQGCDKATPHSTSFKQDESEKPQPAEPEPAQHGLPLGTWKIDAYSVANTREVIPLSGSGRITISRARMEIFWDNIQGVPKYDGYALSETDSQEPERGIIRFKAVPDDPVRGETRAGSTKGVRRIDGTVLFPPRGLAPFAKAVLGLDSVEFALRGSWYVPILNP